LTQGATKTPGAGPCANKKQDKYRKKNRKYLAPEKGLLATRFIHTFIIILIELTEFHAIQAGDGDYDPMAVEAKCNGAVNSLTEKRNSTAQRIRTKE
jgi:hypothetical protein